MAITELKEAIILLKRLPSLWIPGIVGGILTAALWVTLNLSGTFFAGRLLVIFGLVLLLFTTGLLVIIRNNEGDLRTMLTGGIRYYFRVLLPQTHYYIWRHAHLYSRHGHLQPHRSDSPISVW